MVLSIEYFGDYNPKIIRSIASVGSIGCGVCIAELLSHTKVLAATCLRSLKFRPKLLNLLDNFFSEDLSPVSGWFHFGKDTVLEPDLGLRVRKIRYTRAVNRLSVLRADPDSGI